MIRVENGGWGVVQSQHRSNEEDAGSATRETDTPTQHGRNGMELAGGREGRERKWRSVSEARRSQFKA